MALTGARAEDVRIQWGEIACGESIPSIAERARSTLRWSRSASPFHSRGSSDCAVRTALPGCPSSQVNPGLWSWNPLSRKIPAKRLAQKVSGPSLLSMEWNATSQWCFGLKAWNETAWGGARSAQPQVRYRKELPSPERVLPQRRAE